MKAQVGDYIKYQDFDGADHVSRVMSINEYDIGIDYTEWEYVLENGDVILNSDITREDVYLESEMDEG